MTCCTYSEYRRPHPQRVTRGSSLARGLNERARFMMYDDVVSK